jgi:hypothetical protein
MAGHAIASLTWAVAKGLLVDLIVEDARYIATVGVIKISGEMP